MKIAPFTIGTIAVLVISLLAYANTPQTSNGPAPTNPLSGKVVILNPSSITVPHDDARIEELGGKKFVVYPVRGENGTTRESWTAIDGISRMLIFQNMEDANAYVKTAKY